MTITKTELLINKHTSRTDKEIGDKKMNLIKRDDKLFDQSVMHIWVYSKGLLISTNNNRSRSYIQNHNSIEGAGYKDHKELKYSISSQQ